MLEGDMPETVVKIEKLKSRITLRSKEELLEKRNSPNLKSKKKLSPPKSDD